MSSTAGVVIVVVTAHAHTYDKEGGSYVPHKPSDFEPNKVRDNTEELRSERKAMGVERKHVPCMFRPGKACETFA